MVTEENSANESIDSCAGGQRKSAEWKKLPRSPRFEIKDGGYQLTNQYGFLQLLQQSGDASTPITWRSSSEYTDIKPSPRYFENGGISPDILTDPATKSLRVVEVGTGLSGFIPDLSQITEEPPIAIDPINYGVILDILLQTQKKELSTADNDTIATLIGRVRTYLDPKLVTLLNMTVEEACEKNPWLEGVADIVIDVAGAHSYTQDKQRVRQLESEWLLKKDSEGRYFIG